MENGGTDLENLLSKQAIYESIVRMALALDRCDAGAVLDAFWPDGRIESGAFSGTIIEYLPYFEKSVHLFTRLTHQVSNILIEVDGDTARSQTYLDAYHEFEAKPPIRFVGRYIDRSERRGGKWRILRRLLVLDWHEGASSDDEFPIVADKRVRGGRKPSDPWYTDAAR